MEKHRKVVRMELDDELLTIMEKRKEAIMGGSVWEHLLVRNPNKIIIIIK